MSTEREATPPARIWLWDDGREYHTSRTADSDVEYIRSDSFDTMRDALREIKARCLYSTDAGTWSVYQQIDDIASSALAAIDGKDS